MGLAAGQNVEAISVRILVLVGLVANGWGQDVKKQKQSSKELV